MHQEVGNIVNAQVKKLVVDQVTSVNENFKKQAKNIDAIQTKIDIVVEFLPELKADEILVQRARELSNVTIETNVAVQSILSESGKVSAIRYLDRQTDEEKDYPVSGIFVQIGLLPNSQFLGDLVEVNDYGEIEVDAAGRTSQEGIFACGDVTNVAYKQIVIAMGEGAKAALTASEYLMLQSERELPTAEMLSQTS